MQTGQWAAGAGGSETKPEEVSLQLGEKGLLLPAGRSEARVTLTEREQVRSNSAFRDGATPPCSALVYPASPMSRA